MSSNTFPKLRTLQNHLQYAEDDSPNFDSFDREFGGLVQFYQSENAYQQSSQLVAGSNKLFEKLFKEKKSMAPYEACTTGLPTPWKKEPNFEIREFALTLFNLLTNKWPLDCDLPSHQNRHQAKLHLNTWQAPKISRTYAEFDMVFSTHGRPPAWQESTIAISDERSLSASVFLVCRFLSAY